MANRLSMRASTGESGLRILPEAFHSRAHQLAEETVDSLLNIWAEAGYEDLECQRLLGDLLSKLKATCANELAAEQQILEHAKTEVAANVNELIRMNEQLGRRTNVDHILKMNYTDKLAELERMLASVEAVHSQRQSQLEDEMSALKTLANQLGEAVPPESAFQGPPGTPYLSDIRLSLIREHTAGLTALRAKRVEEIRSLAAECGMHMADLKYAEEGMNTMADSERFQALDRAVLRLLAGGDLPATGALTAHRKDLIALTQRLKSFVDEKERRRVHLANTGDEIAKLWSLLRIPSVEREAFQGSFARNLSLDTLRKGDEEVRRLQEIRRKSLGRVLMCIRADILTLWEEASMDHDLRLREFPLYFEEVDSLEDSAVDVHEAYFNYLRERVEELRPILSKIARREAAVGERIELEHLQSNPERLTARGPNAREERKREEAMANRVKNLDKLTKELLAVVAAWEVGNGPFLYAGERYADRVAHQEEHYIETRDGLRNARKRKDGKDLAPPSSTSTMRSTAVLPANKKPATASTMSNSASGPFTTPSAVRKAPQQQLPPPTPVDENCRPPMNRDSEGTVGTSMTELKDRSSTGSETVVRAVDMMDIAGDLL